MVVLFGRSSRPGLPCLRAAVGAYLFHCSGIFAPFVGWAKARVQRSFRVGKIVRAPCPRGRSFADDFAHPTSFADNQNTPRCCEMMASSSLMASAAPLKTTRPVLMMTML